MLTRVLYEWQIINTYSKCIFENCKKKKKRHCFICFCMSADESRLLCCFTVTLPATPTINLNHTTLDTVFRDTTGDFTSFGGEQRGDFGAGRGRLWRVKIKSTVLVNKVVFLLAWHSQFLNTRVVFLLMLAFLLCFFWNLLHTNALFDTTALFHSHCLHTNSPCAHNFNLHMHLVRKEVNHLSGVACNRCGKCRFATTGTCSVAKVALWCGRETL